MITGTLVMDGWAGRSRTVVEIVGSTPKRLKIRALTITRLAGRQRWLEADHTALVPRHAVVDIKEAP